MIIYKLNTIPRYDSAKTVVHANEGEFGGQWVFDIMDGDSLFDLTYGIPEVTINILKADKNVYSNPVARGMDENGRVIVDIKEQMTAAAGLAEAELVFERTGTKKATANFIIDVERSPVNMGGNESESLINYVERNREAAENATALANAAAASAESAVTAAEDATAAAQAAQTAAANAQSVADTAVENVVNAVGNIENMPQTLQALASSLASTGNPQRFLGFDGNGDAAAYDTGFVTPQMFGAKGNGTTDDTAAFEAALASGERVVVPMATYKLTQVLWTDDSVLANNSGTYITKPLIVSKAVRDSAPVERFIKQFNASGSHAVLHLRGACYDSYRNRIVAAYVTARNEYVADESAADLVIKVYDSNFSEVSGSGNTITGMACTGGICYNSKLDKICVATGTANAQIKLLDPVTFTVSSTQNFTDPDNDYGCARQIAYDDANDIYYVLYDNDGDLNTLTISGDFTESLNDCLLDPWNDLIEAIGVTAATGAFYVHGGIVYKEQFLQLIISGPEYSGEYGCNGTYICQYNYESRELKKVYRIGTNYYKGEEPRTLVNVNGKVYCLSNISTTANKNYVSVTQLIMDERVDGEYNDVYKDAKIISAVGARSNLDNYLGVGCYVSPTVAVSTGLSNSPTSYPFVMWVIPVPATVESRMQVLATYHGEIFIRTYVANVDTWYGWRQLAEGPRKNANQSVTWDGAGYVTSGGTEIRFTIPHAMPTEASALPTVTITSLRVNARQGGNYILSSGTDLATASGHTITATATPVGINIAISKTAAFPDVVNNECCGIGATVTMHFA